MIAIVNKGDAGTGAIPPRPEGRGFPRKRMREAEIRKKLLKYIDAGGKTIYEIKAHVGLKGMDALNDLLTEGRIEWDNERGLYRRAGK